MNQDSIISSEHKHDIRELGQVVAIAAADQGLGQFYRPQQQGGCHGK
jgi:hypothetical protein